MRDLRMVSDKYTGELASLISQKRFWRGQTAEQLMDSLGPPDEVALRPQDFTLSGQNPAAQSRGPQGPQW
jgi:hypothetical protein